MPVDLKDPLPRGSCYLCLFIVVLSSSFTFSYQQQKLSCNKQDQRVLLTFASSLSSPLGPLNWSSDSDCCSSWEGIDCAENGRVSRLWLPSKRLSGNLSPMLGNLTSLLQLNLSRNSLTGSLPDGFFSSLNSLKVIDLSSNYLSGNLSASFSSGSFHSAIQVVDISNNRFNGKIEPVWFVLGQKLTSFNASNNGFTGQVPSTICSTCPQLKTLDFSSNLFSGTLHFGLGNCTKLEVFRAGFNNLFGELPEDIYSIQSINELSIPDNNISGTIGGEMLGLTNIKIVKLYLNQISGTIPQDIGKLSQLEQLDLSFNNLIGPLPSSLLNCTNLVKLNLRFNSLQGNISTLDFSRLTQLQILDLGKNYFKGSLPESMFSCKSLVAIRVATNSLNKSISPKFTQLQSLTFLSLPNSSFTNVSESIKNLAGCKSLTALFLSNNFHNETIPSEEIFISPHDFRKLQVFACEGCYLRGQIPAWLANIKTLEVLILNRNQLTGPIPYWLGNLPSLFYLDLSENHLSGEIPQQLCRLKALMSEKAVTELSQVNLVLPVILAPGKASIGNLYNQLSNLHRAIHLNNNQITGKIPVEISQLKNLHVLQLSDNNLSGSIPPQLSKLKNLEILDLSQNNLTGGIPASLQSLNFLSEFDVSYNNLVGPIPIGGQFDTFSESSYVGNPELCGQVLEHPCSHQSNQETLEHNIDSEDNSKKFSMEGFAVGISTVFPVVLVIQMFRHMRTLYKTSNADAESSTEL